MNGIQGRGTNGIQGRGHEWGMNQGYRARGRNDAGCDGREAGVVSQSA